MRSRNVLGRLMPARKRMRPYKRGDRPVVIDRVPREKHECVSCLSEHTIDAFYSALVRPPRPAGLHLHRMASISSRRCGFENVQSVHEELRRLAAAGQVARIQDVDKCLGALVDFDQHDAVIQLVPRMERVFGVKPSEFTESLIAEVALKKDRPQDALTILDARTSLQSGRREEVLFGELVIGALKKNLADGMRLYERYALKATQLAPVVVAAAITACAKQDYVERGFRVYREAREKKQMLPNHLTQTALLYASARRKEYYREAIDCFRQMIAWKMTVSPFDYANLMLATGKVGDMQTALAIWESCVAKGCANEYLAANLFYSLAATESTEIKYSHRPYAHIISRKVIVEAAREIHGQLTDLKLLPNERVLSAYLACMTMHREVEESIRIYYDRLAAFGKRSPSNLENFIRLFDAVRDCDRMEDALHLAEHEGTVMTRMTYRAIVRTYSHSQRHDKVFEWMERMRRAGMIPTMRELQVVYYRICQAGLEEYKEKFRELTIPNPSLPSNPFLPWRQRSIKLAEMLKKAYGPNAPKLATDK